VIRSCRSGGDDDAEAKKEGEEDGSDGDATPDAVPKPVFRMKHLEAFMVRGSRIKREGGKSCSGRRRGTVVNRGRRCCVGRRR
jgi:hypothetical protein